MIWKITLLHVASVLSYSALHRFSLRHTQVRTSNSTKKKRDKFNWISSSVSFCCSSGCSG